MATRKSTATAKAGRILAASAAMQRVVTPCAEAETLGQNELTNSQALVAIIQALDALPQGQPKAPILLVLAAANQAFDLAYGCYWEVQPDQNVLLFACDSGHVSDDFRRLTAQTQVHEGQGLSGRAWRQRDLVWAHDLASLTDTARGPLAQQAGIRSGLALPIIVQGAVHGVMEYFSTESAALSATRESVWKAIGSLVSSAITAAQNAAEQSRASRQACKLHCILENSPTAVMQCNLDLKIEYMNQASFQLLRKLETQLPCRPEEVVGRSIDIFHRHPEKHRELLKDPKNLPHQAQIRLGDEHLRLIISALRDETGAYVGPMLTWEQVTEKVAAEELARQTLERERREAEELARKVDSLLACVQAAARGDLMQQIQFAGDSPIDRLGAGFHQLLADLRNSLGEIRHNVLTLSGAAEELSATSKQMQLHAIESSGQVTAASAAGEQVNQNIHMVASASEQMTASIREIAKSSHQAARVSGSAVEVANSTNQTISKLSESSSEIGKVIKVISSIAQQTNLLALNATIEAARAGESGRGFAVVANEVKELAKETAKATGDITLKIEAIQADSQCAVQAIAKITQIIQEISDIASTIAGAVEEQSVTTCEISRSVSEAAKGSTEISRVIDGVAISAQHSRVGADETLQAAQSLSVLASQLQKLLGQFRL